MEIKLEGNNGGDIFELRVLGDGRIDLEVGHCCVKTIHHIVPVEFLTAILTNAVLDAGNVRKAIQNLDWSQEFKDKLISQIEDLDNWAEILDWIPSPVF